MMQWFVVPLWQAVVIIHQAQKPNSEIKSIHLHFSFLTSEWKSRGCDIHNPRMCDAKTSVNFDAQSDTFWEHMHHTVCLASVVSVSGFALCFHRSCVYICCHSPWIYVKNLWHHRGTASVATSPTVMGIGMAESWTVAYGIRVWNTGLTSNHQSCSAHLEDQKHSTSGLFLAWASLLSLNWLLFEEH